MLAVLQRVAHAQVDVEDETVGQIGRGLLVYLSVGPEDQQKDAGFIADKIAHLRVFADADDKMNLSVQDVGAAVLLVSQFTLHGDCRKGRRPSFDRCGPPELARELYELCGSLIAEYGVAVEWGRFAAHMEVRSINDGPVTFILNSRGS